MNSTITIAGNVTRDPELRFTSSGIPTTSFSVVVNRRINTRTDSAPTEVVSFFTVVAWNAMAANACVSLTKGSRVVVSGRLEQRSWQTLSGEKRTVYELVADEIGASLRFANAAIERNQRVPASIDDLRAVVLGAQSPEPQADLVCEFSTLDSTEGSESGEYGANVFEVDRGESRNGELVGAGSMVGSSSAAGYRDSDPFNL